MIKLAPTLVFLFSLSLMAQDSEFIQATYQRGSAKEYLQRDVSYPKMAKDKNISGDIVYRVTIDEHGTLDSIKRVNPGNPLLNQRTTKAMEKLTGAWNPTRENGIAIAYEYLIVFRFRLDLGEGSAHYERRSQRFMDKEKWQKALEVTDEWQLDDAYNVTMWNHRARILTALGRNGAHAAGEKATHLAREVLLNVPIVAEGNKYLNSNGAVERFD